MNVLAVLCIQQKEKILSHVEMMKAIRQNEIGGELLIESIPIPEPGPGEVLVKMTLQHPSIPLIWPVLKVLT